MSQYLNQLLFAALLALPVACVSWTVSNEEVFRDLRDWLDKVSQRSRNLLIKKACYLPTCHYCLSHWITAMFLLLTGFTFLLNDWRGYILSEFAVVMIANVYLTLYSLLRVSLRRCRAQADEAQARAAIMSAKAAEREAQSEQKGSCSAKPPLSTNSPGGNSCGS